jgi:hypothetical protein
VNWAASRAAVVLTTACVLFAACGAAATPTPVPSTPPTPTPASDPLSHDAQVVDVLMSGPDGAFLFGVTVTSPDTGCDSFVDWWEVVTPDGELLYRRVLLHSHVGEQPFTREGGPVAAGPADEVIVRAHMNTTGYSPSAMRGSFRTGFSSAQLERGFAANAEALEPLPDGCAF